MATRTRTVLADWLVAGDGLAWDAVRILFANILLVLCAWIALPLPWTSVPVTGQTFAVLLIAVLLGSTRSATVMVLYLMEGLAGLPVFQPFGLPGAARFLGPTAGYLLAYPAAAFAAGWVIERMRARAVARLGAALLFGEFIIFAGGCAWLAQGLQFGWGQAITAGLLPFLGGEVVKMLLIAAAVQGLELARARR